MQSSATGRLPAVRHTSQPIPRAKSTRANYVAASAAMNANTGGTPVASNLEMRFSKIRRINQFGYHTVNLSFQLDDHRMATSILDAWFELSSLIAKGVRRFQVLKPEPMFGVSTEILANHIQQPGHGMDEGLPGFPIHPELQKDFLRRHIRLLPPGP